MSENEDEMHTGKMLAMLMTFGLLLWVPVGQQTLAADFTVNSSSDCTLADAIKAANRDEAVGSCGAGQGKDTIVVTSNITLSANLPDIVSNITVKSHNGTKHSISGAGVYHIFNIDNGGKLTLEVLQLIAGRYYGARGGAVRVLSGRANLTDVRMEDNWAEKGGGALRVGNGSSATCNKCQFVDNHSPIGGAIWVGDEGSNLVLENSMVYNNSADKGGGMYIKHGSATISGTTFSNNSADEGADILSVDAELTIQPSVSMSGQGLVRK